MANKPPKAGEEQGESHLNPDLRAKYRIKDTDLPKVLNTVVGDIEFATLTEEQAETLVKSGFAFLEKL